MPGKKNGRESALLSALTSTIIELNFCHTTVDNDCVSKYQELKLKKSYKYIIFNIDTSANSIKVKKLSTDGTHDDFLADLPDAECRFAVVDFPYKTGTENRNKIVFVDWTPVSARAREQMLYASARDTLRKALTGIGIEIQATDSAEVSHDSVLEKATRKH